MTLPEPWQWDKRVPVAIILALVGQAVLAIWWGATLSNDVDRLKVNDTRQEALIDRMATTSNAQAVQLGRIEEISLGTQRAIADLGRKIDARDQP